MLFLAALGKLSRTPFLALPATTQAISFGFTAAAMPELPRIFMENALKLN
jgi:hypothetical protein